MTMKQTNETAAFNLRKDAQQLRTESQRLRDSAGRLTEQAEEMERRAEALEAAARKFARLYSLAEYLRRADMSGENHFDVCETYGARGCVDVTIAGAERWRLTFEDDALLFNKLDAAGIAFITGKIDAPETEPTGAQFDDVAHVGTGFVNLAKF